MNLNKWYIKLALSVLTGLILSLAWYVRGAALLIMLAFVPLFWLSDISLKEGKRNAFGRGILLFYPAFFVFNLITTYWIAFCTVPGAAAAVIANALLQTLTFSAWHACRKQVENRFLQLLLLISFWISFEYLHLNWDLTWPWLNLGNVFAVCPQWVQWYSITGAMGGTVWILLLNFLLYYLIRQQAKTHRVAWGFITASALVFLIPVILSALMFKNAGESIDKSRPVNVVAVQQNTDPWEEEYSLTISVEHLMSNLRNAFTIASSLVYEKSNFVQCDIISIIVSYLEKRINFPFNFIFLIYLNMCRRRI